MTRGWRALAVGMLASFPVVLLTPFPTQDGPAHIYGAYLLDHLHGRNYPCVSRIFEFSSVATSTLAFQRLLSVLLHLVPAPWIEKLIVLVVVAWLFAVCVGSAERDDAPFFPLCALPLFALSFVVRMGFFSFCVCIPLALHAVGLWTSRGSVAATRNLILAAAMVALLPLFHVLAASWALALIGACSLASLFRGRLPRIRELGIVALASCPLFAVAFGYPRSSDPYEWQGIGERLAALVAGGAFVGAGPGALWLSAVPSVLLLVLGFLWVLDTVRTGTDEGWRRIVVTAAALVLALVAPEAEGAGGAYVGVRGNLLFFLLLLVMFRRWPIPRHVDALLAVVFLAFSTVHAAGLYARLKPASAAEREIAASAAHLDDHTMTFVVVAGPWLDATAPTLTTQVRPLLHAGDLLGVGADRAVLTFYEAGIAFFPVIFTHDASPVGVLYDATLFGWTAPEVDWNRLPTWKGGVDYVGIWDEQRLLAVDEGARFRDVICAHYEEAYRSDVWPWVIYHLDRAAPPRQPPRICQR